MEPESIPIRCSICLDTPKDAVETDCCGQIFCQNCLDQLGTKTCPYCRKPEVTHHINWFVRRSVENTIACPSKCGVKVHPSAIKDHLLSCVNKEYHCPAPKCEAKGQRSEFIGHLTEHHTDELVDGAAKLFQSLKVDKAIQCQRHLLRFDYNSEFFLPAFPFVKNNAGHLALLAKNRKYYCRRKLYCLVTDCCTYKTQKCGPDGGCNCEPCMMLDIKERRMPEGWLLNSDGTPTRHIDNDGQLGVFACGRKYQEKCQSVTEEAYCGSVLGRCCNSCRCLTTHVARGMYKTILGIK